MISISSFEERKVKKCVGKKNEADSMMQRRFRYLRGLRL